MSLASRCRRIRSGRVRYDCQLEPPQNQASLMRAKPDPEAHQLETGPWQTAKDIRREQPSRQQTLRALGLPRQRPAPRSQMFQHETQSQNERRTKQLRRYPPGPQPHRVQGPADRPHSRQNVSRPQFSAANPCAHDAPLSLSRQGGKKWRHREGLFRQT